jgi:hypothetical protein
MDQPVAGAYLREMSALGLHLLLERRVRRQRRVHFAVERRFDRFGGLRRVGRQLRRIHLAAERRDFDRLWSVLDVREAEAAADDPAVAKELSDLVGMRGRADVEVLGTPAEQQIAHAAAHQIRDVIVLVEAVQNLERVRINVAARNRML